MIKLPYKYIWQNPTLRSAMYPFREQKLRDFLLLYDEADLVIKHASKPTAERVAQVKAELQTLRQRYESMQHDSLIKEILDRFDADPARQRYPDWLRYATLHFSGMRYKSAHGSWANPSLLIAKLEEMARETLNKAAPQQLAEMAAKAGLQHLPADVAARKNALFNHLTARELAAPGQTHEAANLVALERLLMMKERMGFPRWFWKEVVSHTDLRLAVQKGDWLNDWENLSLEDMRERQQSVDFRWQTIMSGWKQDVTVWRQKHYSDLTLVVTRVVCNELSEHIHHLRGIKPASGLTAKPTWYVNLMGRPAPKKPDLKKAKDEPKKKKVEPPQPVKDLADGQFYFGQALNRSYFKPGASILSLGWVTLRPNPWQIAQPISGIDFEAETDPSWKYSLLNNEFIRAKPAPPPPGKPQPKHKDEKAGPQAKSKAPELKEWLRWTHEAIVVGVFDLLDGPNVITFETYPKIGINRTHLLNKQKRWSEFIGVHLGSLFDPLKDGLKIANLGEMLKRQNLLPATGPGDDFLSFEVQPAMAGAEPFGLEIEGQPAAAVREIAAVWDSLSKRQKEVVALICQGYSTRQAATRLDTSPSTVQTHLSHAMRAFGVSSRRALQALLANWDFGELEEDSSE